METMSQQYKDQSNMPFSQQLDNRIESVFCKLITNNCNDFDKSRHKNWYILAIVSVLIIIILIGSFISIWLSQTNEEKKWIKIIALVLLVIISLLLFYQLKRIL